MQVIRYNHAANQNRINADAYHYEEALKTEGEHNVINLKAEDIYSEMD